MNEARLRGITSVLNRYELTFQEKRFVEAVKEYFKERGILTEQQESILEGIFREKIKWGSVVFKKNSSGVPH